MMEFARKTVICLFVLAVALAPRGASAAPVSATSRASAVLLHPLTLVRKNDLDFGDIALTGAGTVTINPVSNALTTSGGALAVGGTPAAATFVGAAGSSSVVNIRLPRNPVLIRRVGGTETMSVGAWTLQGQNKRTLARQESFEFRVGATLTVAAAQADGEYEGSFDVTVQYP